MAFEMMNLISAKKALSEVDSNLNRLAMFSASLDITVALAHAGNLYAGEASRFAQVARLGAVGFIGGMLTAAVCAMTAVQAWNANDRDAGIAMGMVAVGTAVTTVATTFFKTSSAALFGMGPVAWVGIVIALIGFGLYMYFKDSPIEAWLKNGPFRLIDKESGYPHLQRP